MKRSTVFICFAHLFFMIFIPSPTLILAGQESYPILAAESSEVDFGQAHSLQEKSSRLAFAPDQIVFKLSRERNNRNRILGPQAKLSQITAEYQFKNLNTPFTQTGSDGGGQIYTAQLPEGADPLDTVKSLEQDAGIEWAEPLYYRYINSTTPNDPDFYSTTLNLNVIGIMRAWDTTTGSGDIVVGILDTGVDWTHEDLQDNIWTNPGEIPDDGIDNDQNGYIDDIRGWDFVAVSESKVWPGEDYGPEDNDPMDYESHGTHVAGIVGAKGNNGIGVAGVCWNVSLMPLRAGFKDNKGQGVLDIISIANGLRYAADNGADIVNMSFGSPGISHTEREAIDYCHKAGVLLIAAAGNDEVDAPHYPAAYENVIAVSAVSWNPRKMGMTREYYSNYGSWVDIAAPGRTYSTLPGNDYGNKSGTSMASPFAAGVAALIKSVHPDFTADQLRLRLLATAYNINPANEGLNNLLGSGVIQADEAVEATVNPAKIGVFELVKTEITGNMDGIPDPGETFMIQPFIKNFGHRQSGVSVEVSTGDPYLTILSDSATFDPIDHDHISGSNEFIEIYINPSAPRDYTAILLTTLSVDGVSLGQTDELFFDINPTFRSFQYAEKYSSTAEHSKPSIFNLTNGESLVLYKTSGFGAINNVFGQSGSAQAGWDTPQPLFYEGGLQYAHNYAAALDANDVIHVVATGNVASWDDEFFYRSYNPDSDTWSGITQLTADAEIYGTQWAMTDFICAVDPNSNVFHLVWIDYRNGHPDFYHLSYNGNQWSNETIIYTPFLEEKQYKGDFTGFLFDRSGMGNLLWTDEDNKQIQSMTYENHRWSNPNILISYSDSYQSASAVIDTNDTIHLSYNEYADSRSLQYMYREPNYPWSEPLEIASGVNRGSTLLAVVPDHLYIFYQADDPDYPFMIHYEVYAAEYNGSSWSNRMITKTRTGIPTLQYFSYGVDLDGNLQMLSSYGDDPDDYNGLWSFILGSSEYDQTRMPTDPVVTDEGLTTPYRKSLSADWISTHPSGIDKYDYALGTYPGGTDLRFWSSIGSLTHYIKNLQDTPLQIRQNYFVTVRAFNGFNYSAIGSSDGILCQPADQDGNGLVGLGDLDMWLVNWLGDCGECDGYDFDLDDDVDINDWNHFSDNWLWQGLP